MKATLQELFIESAIMQGLLTVMLWGTALFLMVSGRDIPDLLAVGAGAIMSFWFRTKTTARVIKAIKENDD